jgi:23S rRNA pseudouridine955/2504/2580 synthase/23S rRNA pseudouridine1911/1915/1917 synthase
MQGAAIIKRPEVIFENEEFIVLNKPAGLLSIPDRFQSSESLKDILQKKFDKIFTVHRLDKDTSGLILFAKNESAHQYFSEVFGDRKVEKYYEGLVQGVIHEKKGIISEPIAEHPSKNGKMVIHKKGKPSLTEYEVLEEFGICSLVRFRIHTGRTHQIRIHMKHSGHSLLCDELYGNPDPIFLSAIKRNFKKSGQDDEEEKPLLSRLALHAQRLAFMDSSGKKYEFEAPFPRDMKALVQQLRKWTH